MDICRIIIRGVRSISNGEVVKDRVHDFKHFVV